MKNTTSLGLRPNPTHSPAWHKNHTQIASYSLPIFDKTQNYCKTISDYDTLKTQKSIINSDAFDLVYLHLGSLEKQS